MSDWQERITHQTAPAIRVEHDLRYLSAASLILAGGPWADLGCGNGLAAASALGERRPADVVLVDVDENAVATAAAELGLAGAHRLSGDLTDPTVLERIGTLLAGAPGEPVITCFEVVEHLSTFLPLLEWAGRMVAERNATFVLSVPNDAFWAAQNPHHLTSWGEGAFDELRQLLPPERTLLRQIALNGSALADWDAGRVAAQLSVETDSATAVASHFIVAFGPRHSQLSRGALAMQADAAELRRWEREHESNAVGHLLTIEEHRRAMEQQDLTIAKQAEELRAQTDEFDAWRTYIHELEAELGRSPSGSKASDDGESPATTEADSAR